MRFDIPSMFVRAAGFIPAEQPAGINTAARKARRWFPAKGLLVLTVAVLLAGFLLGLRADTEPRVPGTSAEGIVCHVCQPPGEPIHGRCAVVLPYGLEEIWSALTDYERYGDICASVHDTKVTHDAAGNCRVVGQGDSLLGGQLPFEVRIDHDRQLDRCTVTWTDTGGDLRNRGQWVLTPLKPEETLVELKQDVQVQRAPAFMVRSFLLPRMRQTVMALEQRLLNGPTGNPW